ncbi:hypothetical protein T06_7927 [Trichinella sp. T6]|nr:hypothetical protein T06_7927 [Trichinella sp. T6]
MVRITYPRLSGTSAARKYLSKRMNHRSTSKDRVSASGGIIQRGFSDILPRSPTVAPSGARFILIIYDTEVRGTRDYTKGYDAKVKQTGTRTPYHYRQCTHDTTTFVFFLSYPIKAHLMFRYNRHRVFIGRYLELTIRLVSHGSFQHGFGFSGIQHMVESYHSFSASQGAQGKVEDASMPGDEASRRKSVTAEQESICISSGPFSTVPVTTKSHIVGISGLNIHRAVIINRWSGPVSAAANRPAAPLSGHAQDSSLGPRCQFSGNLNIDVLVVRSSNSKPQLRSRLTVGRPSVWCAYAGSTRIVQGTSRVDAYPDALNTTLLLSALLLELRRGRLQNSPAHISPAVRILPLALYQ